MDANGKNTHLIKEFPFAFGGSIDWSPKGDWIAIIYEKEIYSDGACGDIYLIRPDGNDLTKLTELKNCAAQVVWSPDGEYLAFIGRNNSRANMEYLGSQIYIMDVSSRDIYQITSKIIWFISEIDWSYTATLK
jgi:Tol biopolymer transport system component